MWHAAQPVARKLPLTAFAGVQRWQEVHSLRSRDRKSTRLNSSHGYISYAVFCLKKKKTKTDLARELPTATTSIDIKGLPTAYPNSHTDQERDYFMQRSHAVSSPAGGKLYYEAET